MHTISENLRPSQQSLWLSAGQQKLHLMRFCGSERGVPVFMVHGSVEDGHIFYSDSGKGLAPWLACRGFDVFVADLRGRGKSSPAVSAASHWGLREMMEEDFPAMLAEIERLCGTVPQHWIAHSWGGVMQLAYLARWSAHAPIASLTFFGTKRSIYSWSLRKLLMLGLGWSVIGELLTRVWGYLPARKFGFGSENESAATYRQTRRWVTKEMWRDSQDGFDYAAALKGLALPPALYITGAGDKVLGDARDVRYLMLETGVDQRNKLVIAGKLAGFKHNYDHIDLLTHRDAPADVFVHIEKWLRQYSFEKAGK